MAKVTGIGGVFFKSQKDDRALAQWYTKNLGFPAEEYGCTVFEWPKDQAEDKGLTVWKVAEKDTQWFAPSSSNLMINYRIDDMDGMLKQLTENGVEILSGPESHENGRFAWILDPEGNKIELWEPMLWDEKNKNS